MKEDFENEMVIPWIDESKWEILMEKDENAVFHWFLIFFEIFKMWFSRKIEINVMQNYHDCQLGIS